MFIVLVKVQLTWREIKMFHRRTKHIDIKFNFIRDKVKHKRLGLVKIDTNDNPADMMMKPLPTNKFTLCMNLVGLAPCLMCCPLGHV